MAWPIYKTKDDVPKEFLDEYHEDDGKWVVKPAKVPEGTPTQADLDKVKGALDKEREERKASDKLGKETAAKLKAAEEAAKGDKLGLTEKEIEEFKDKIRADLTEETKGEISGLKEKLEAKGDLEGKIHKLQLDTAIQTLMLSKDVGVRGDRVKELFALSKDEFDLTEDGKPKLVNHPGKTVDQFLKDDLKKRLPEFYKGTQASGGGGGGAFNSDGSPIVGTSADEILKNPKEAIEASRAQEAAAK